MAMLWEDILNILQTPFVGSLDIVHLFLLVGLVLVFATMWALVLNHVRLAELE